MSFWKVRLLVYDVLVADDGNEDWVIVDVVVLACTCARAVKRARKVMDECIVRFDLI